MSASDLQYVATNKLKPWDRNPRKNDGEPVDKVVESIKRFGFAAPIVARKSDNRIIAGHTRWKAATKLGMDNVPVRYVELSDDESSLLALADNRLTELTPWDNDKLDFVLNDFTPEDREIAGFSLGDLFEAKKEESSVSADNINLESKFLVLITCSDESTQQVLLERFIDEGLDVKALIS